MLVSQAADKMGEELPPTSSQLSEHFVVIFGQSAEDLRKCQLLTVRRDSYKTLVEERRRSNAVFAEVPVSWPEYLAPGSHRKKHHTRQRSSPLWFFCVRLSLRVAAGVMWASRQCTGYTCMFAAVSLACFDGLATLRCCSQRRKPPSGSSSFSNSTGSMFATTSA